VCVLIDRNDIPKQQIGGDIAVNQHWIINHNVDDYQPYDGRLSSAWAIDSVVAKTLALVLRGGFYRNNVFGRATLIFHQSLATEGETTAS
jgi:hypothetical protein